MGTSIPRAARSRPPTPPSSPMPSRCSDSLDFGLHIDSWQDQGNFVSASTQTTDEQGNPVGVTDCDALDFNPTLQARPTTNVADSPSGLDVDLHVPQTQQPQPARHLQPEEGASSPCPRASSLNPSAANGLDACSASQIGLTSPIGQTPIRFAPPRRAAPTPRRSARSKSTPRCSTTPCRAPSTSPSPSTTPSTPSSPSTSSSTTRQTGVDRQARRPRRARPRHRPARHHLRRQSPAAVRRLQTALLRRRHGHPAHPADLRRLLDHLGADSVVELTEAPVTPAR